MIQGVEVGVEEGAGRRSRRRAPTTVEGLRLVDPVVSLLIAHEVRRCVLDIANVGW